MTCEECRRLFNTNPRAATAAERAAVSNHLKTCKTCFPALEEMVIEKLKKLPPALVPLAVLHATLEAAEMYEKDRHDPEAKK